MAGQTPSSNSGQQISIHAQYVKDLSFESPAAPGCFVKAIGQPDVHISVNVSTERINETLFEVELKLVATAKVEEQTLFIAELVYAGLISATGISDDSIEPLMVTEGPRLLFPFARAIMSDITRDGGFLPLNLNPVDFIALHKNNTANSNNRNDSRSNTTAE